jgi:hypothetical protein
VSAGTCGFRLSLRHVEELMAWRGLAVDHTTVWRWCQKYGPVVYERLKGRRIQNHNPTTWHMDETYVRVAGRSGFHPYIEDVEVDCLGWIELSAEKSLPLCDHGFRQIEIHGVAITGNGLEYASMPFEKVVVQSGSSEAPASREAAAFAGDRIQSGYWHVVLFGTDSAD